VTSPRNRIIEASSICIQVKQDEDNPQSMLHVSSYTTGWLEKIDQAKFSSSEAGAAYVPLYDLADIAAHLLSSIGKNYIIHLNVMR